ncbi:MAG: hypothetical protein B5M56_06735 [Desulfococcus sp. 4484_241]|nr:MAG: hypothetical protein B5M56_06735 [Desulfococcus sp. 4484_241]RLC31350.1 MAG: hypothetical protein DRH32_04390 [Deltaproteobacteria bacterium]
MNQVFSQFHALLQSRRGHNHTEYDHLFTLYLVEPGRIFFDLAFLKKAYFINLTFSCRARLISPALSVMNAWGLKANSLSNVHGIEV